MKKLILRTCNANMTSYESFVWPRSGHVAAPDWNPIAECGQGLHGWLWGEGDGGLGNWQPDAVWLVAEIEEYIDLGGKVKFPEANVVFAGDRKAATDYLLANGGAGKAVIGAFVTSGNYGTSTSGYRGTSTSGDGGRIEILHHDGNRYRKIIGYVGEDGIEANTPYVVRDGKLVKK